MGGPTSNDDGSTTTTTTADDDQALQGGRRRKNNFHTGRGPCGTMGRAPQREIPKKLATHVCFSRAKKEGKP